VLDLNSDGAATVPTTDELADLSRLSSELCKLLGDFSFPVGPLPSPIPPFPFVDPLPFDAGAVRERVVVGAHAGHTTIERVVYRAMAPIIVGQRVIGAFRLGSRLYVRAPNLILATEVRGRALGQWTVAWVPGEHPMRHDGRHVLVDGPHSLTLGEHLRPAHTTDTTVAVQRRSPAPTNDQWAHFIEWDDVAFEWVPGSDQLTAYERHTTPMAVPQSGRSASRSR
jgi:hypothetical protein